MKPSEWNFACFSFFLYSFFQLWSGLAGFLIIIFMFAASKIEIGANRVNVRNLFKMIENVFIYLFIYYVFVKRVIFFCQEEQNTGGKNSVSDTSEQSSFSKKKELLNFSSF